jgi:hypothetical protein
MAEGSAHREIGRFDVSGGQLVIPAGSEAKAPQGLWHYATRTLARLGGAILNALVPAAQAVNLTASSSLPTLFYDDTDDAGNDWTTAAYDAGTVNASWRLADLKNTFGYVFTAYSSANNSNSFIVDTLGDITMANGAMFIDRSLSQVGIGTVTPSPTASLHVFRSNGTAKVLAQDAQVPGNPAAPQTMFELIRPGAVRFDLVDEFNGNTWVFQNRNGAFDITLAGTGVQEFKVDSSGNLTIQGSLIQLSDAKAKADVRAVDGKEILTRLASLPISEWRYKKDASNSPHLGPMAQDFHAAFGLGADDRYIAPMDAAGVALVGVKELNRTLEKEIKVCDAEITALKQRLAALETALNRVLAARPAHLVAAHIGQPH